MEKMKDAAQYVEVGAPESDYLRVTRQGARLTVNLGGVAVMGEFERGDGKAGITHTCSPIFGPDKHKLYGLVQHGMMRNEPSKVNASTPNQIMIKHIVTDAGYPPGVVVEETLGIENSVFSFAMAHHNSGQEKVPLNAGLHCYFDAPTGYKGTKVNNQDISSLIEQHPDGAPIALPARSIIQIPGKPQMQLVQDSFRFAMVWAGRNPQTDEIDKTYVCIEPIELHPDEFGQPVSNLHPSGKRTSSFDLSYI